MFTNINILLTVVSPHLLTGEKNPACPQAVCLTNAPLVVPFILAHLGALYDNCPHFEFPLKVFCVACITHIKHIKQHSIIWKHNVAVTTQGY